MGNILHNVLVYWVGLTGSVGKIDRIGFWTAITAVGTVTLALIAWVQLRKMNKTSKTDFLHRFTQDFFSYKTRNLLMLFDYNLLKFKMKKLDNGEYPFFELDTAMIADIGIIDEKDRAHTKTFYSAYDIDDDLLGFFEDIGNYVKDNLLDINMVYEIFSWYIITIWENQDIQQYIRWQRSDGEDIWSGFEYIYNRCNLLMKK